MRTVHLRYVMLVAALVPIALACGPWFNDAHHGLQRDPLSGSLEQVYASLIRPGTPLTDLSARAQQACTRALEQQKAHQWAAERSAWEEALPLIGFDADLVGLWQVREARDCCDLLPLVGTMITPEEWIAYRAALGEPKGTTVPPPAPTSDPLLELASERNDQLAAAALTSLAWKELLGRNPVAANAHLDRAMARSPRGAKVDEIAYLQAVAPMFAHLDRDGQVDAPGQELAVLTAWIAAHPHSPWRCHAQGWLAGLLYHYPQLVAGPGEDGVEVAARLWQQLLIDPDASELFIPAAQSLRFAYRRLKNHVSSELVQDPRHAAALAWFSVHDAWSSENRSALLHAAAPGLAHLATTTDIALLGSLATITAANGDDAAALTLAARSLAAHDDPGVRYLVARLTAEQGDPRRAEQLAAPLLTGPQAFDLLVRIGSAWEAQSHWDRALASYVSANSATDITLLADGAMPLADLQQAVDHGRPFRAAITPTWSYLWEPEDGLHAGHDYLPLLRQALACRLVCADRPREALPYFEGELRGLCAGLIALQNQLAHATPASLSDCRWALACFWYDPGRRLVFRGDPGWHQWAHPRSEAMAKFGPVATLAQQAAYADTMERMTVYWRAYPMFLAIANEDPKFPHAADALYHAALCRYWLTGKTYLKTSDWWTDRAKQEGYWAQGDALLRRLAAKYTQDPLAQDPKVRRACGLPSLSSSP